MNSGKMVLKVDARPGTKMAWLIKYFPVKKLIEPYCATVMRRQVRVASGARSYIARITRLQSEVDRPLDKQDIGVLMSANVNASMINFFAKV